MTNEKMPHVIGVRHVGLSAQYPAVLADFYHDVLALKIVSTDTVALGPTDFLSSHPEEGSVDLVFFANPGLQHTAFEVSSLADLRAFISASSIGVCRSRWSAITECRSRCTSPIPRGT
jgi:catechol-2,3-dioxygenase